MKLKCMFCSISVGGTEKDETSVNQVKSPIRL